MDFDPAPGGTRPPGRPSPRPPLDFLVLGHGNSPRIESLTFSRLVDSTVELLDILRTVPEAALWVVPNAAHILGVETWRKGAFEEEVRRFLLRG
jgi:hypothetical protein